MISGGRLRRVSAVLLATSLAFVVLPVALVAIAAVALAALLVVGSMLVPVLLFSGVVGAVCLLAARVVQLLVGLFDAARARLESIDRSSNRAPVTVAVGPWSAQDAVLDREYSAQIAYQLNELLSYRTEFLTLTGFLAVIASAAAVLAPVAAALIAALFLATSVYGWMALNSFPPESGAPTPLLEALEVAHALKLESPPDAKELRLLAFRGRAEAYATNVESIRARHNLIRLIRVVLIVAIGTLIAAAA